MSSSRDPAAVALRAIPLGIVLGFHLCLAAFSLVSGYHVLFLLWGLFVVALCTFHILEFTWAAAFEPATVTAEAFLLNHSRAYHVSIIVAILEFAIEAFFFSEWKVRWALPVAGVGLSLVLFGQVIRSLGMWTAGRNFTHLIAEQKRSEHVLVQTGLYAVLRHPAYFGEQRL